MGFHVVQHGTNILITLQRRLLEEVPGALKRFYLLLINH
jgi:hypothetical protein